MNFGTIVRIAAILLGIVSTTVMTDRASGILYDDWFENGVEIADGYAKALVTPFELFVVVPVLGLANERGLAFWHSHWRHVFALLWLLFGAMAQLHSALRSGGGAVFGWLWGGVCALGAGLLSGTDWISSPVIIWWPLAGAMLFAAGLNFWIASVGSRQGDTWVANFGGELLRSGAFVLTAFVVVAALLASGHHANLFEGMPSPAFLAEAIAVALIAAAIPLYRLVTKAVTLQDWISDTPTRRSFDILAVLGGAAVIVCVAHWTITMRE